MTTDPSFLRTPAGKWIKKQIELHREPSPHYQGLYILTADGFGPTRLFDYPAWNADNVLRYLDKGLAFVKGHQVVAADLTEEKLQAPYIVQPDATTSVLHEFSRMPDAPKSELNSSVDRDRVWIYQDEIQELLSHTREAAGEFLMPPTFSARMARFQLVDDIGGRATVFTGPKHVRRAAFYARITRAAVGHVRFAFTGTWNCGTEDNTIGIEGKIEGEFEVDSAALRIDKFRAYAEATAWGGGNPGHTEMPPKGKFKLVFAFLEANDVAGRSIPPAAAYAPEYHDSWNWLTPGAR